VVSIEEVIAALEAADGPNYALEVAICDLVKPEWRTTFGGPPPAYTASTDAALTLVPPGVEWQISTADLVAPEFHAYVRNELYAGFGATPAIALCIAALRPTPKP
jgi:hypothetical protein